MKYHLLLSLFLSGCGIEASPKIPTYDELVAYPNNCANKVEQLKELHKIQEIKNFPQDPDNILNEEDRAYNSRLKSTIWWYAYRCEK